MTSDSSQVWCPFFTTKFPESKRQAIGLFTALVDILDDQVVLFVPLRSTRIPFSMSFKTPELFSRGDTFVYHIPHVKFPELKKPSSVIPPAETIISPSLMDWLTAKLSTEVQVFDI
ncbi:hypothetical protein AAZX31_12G133700 [Glycine max]